eukprot:3393143-Pleurochrysis_carterae.AAC.2
MGECAEMVSPTGRPDDLEKKTKKCGQRRQGQHGRKGGNEDTRLYSRRLEQRTCTDPKLPCLYTRSGAARVKARQSFLLHVARSCITDIHQPPGSRSPEKQAGAQARERQGKAKAEAENE